MRLSAWVLVCAACAGGARAQEEAPASGAQSARPVDAPAAGAGPPAAGGGPPAGWQAQLGLSGDLSLRRRIADRDDRARLAVASLTARAELSYGWGALRLGASLSAERAHYEWTRPRGLSAPELSAGQDPWREVQSFDLGVSLLAFVGRGWTIAARASLGLGVEPGADAGEALRGGGGLAVGYAFSRAFTLGLGLFATTRLEESPLVIPNLFVRWQVTEHVLVETVGPGLRVTWQVTPALALGGRAGFGFRQWRLDDRRARNPGGIVNDAQGELVASLGWTAGPLRLSGEVGAVVWQELTVRDRRGEQVRRLQGEPAPLFALRLELSF